MFLYKYSIFPRWHDVNLFEFSYLWKLESTLTSDPGNGQSVRLVRDAN